jgi:hypothetical protein
VAGSSTSSFRVVASHRTPKEACALPVSPAYERWTVAERRAHPALAPARSLSARLAAVAAASPSAPLSFAAVRVLGPCASADALADALEPVAEALARTLSPFDFAGMIDARTVGVILQGRGAVSAGRFERRLRDELRESMRGLRPWRYEVSVATGVGSQADVLALAACDALPDAG